MSQTLHVVFAVWFLDTFTLTFNIHGITFPFVKFECCVQDAPIEPNRTGWKY
jgi:hypothetical protein